MRRFGERAAARAGAADPDIASLSDAIDRIADPALRREPTPGAQRRRAERDWKDTVEELAELRASQGFG
jgi:hypothetical protein